MSQELLFELDNVRVTPYLAQFGATSYQIASISSVRALQSRKLSRIAIFVFFLGVALFVVAMAKSGTEQRADANFSLAVMLLRLHLPPSLCSSLFQGEFTS